MIASSQKKNNYSKNFFRAKRAGGVKNESDAECESDLKYYIIWWEKCTECHRRLFLAIFSHFLPPPRTPQKIANFWKIFTIFFEKKK